MIRINSTIGTQMLLPAMAMVMLLLALCGSLDSDNNKVPEKSLTQQQESDKPVQLQEFHAVVPMLKVIVSHDLYLIFELTLLAEFKYEQEPNQVGSTRGSYLRTLFGRIIPINAP